MKLYRTTATIVLLFCLQISFAQTTEKWTLEKCITYALENNIQVRQANVMAKQSGIDALQSKLNLLPTIDANASFSDNFGNGFNPQTYSFAQGNSQSVQMQLNGSLPIFTGLQQLYNIQRAKYTLMASKFDYEAVKNDMALNVASAFLQVLLNKEIEKVAVKKRDLTKDQQDIVQSKIKAGALSETALYEIQSQLGRDEVDVVNAKNAIDLALLSLEQLLQIKEKTDFDISAPEVKADNMADIASLNAEAIFEYAATTQPKVKAGETRVKISEATRKMYYGALSPTLAAFGGLSTGYFSQDRKVSKYDTISIPGFPPVLNPAEYSTVPLKEEFSNNFRKVIGLQLDIPLFSKGQKILNLQKNKLELELNRIGLEGIRINLRQDIEKAYANAKASVDAYFVNQKSYEVSQKSYQSVESRYKAGLATNFDMQQAKDNMIAAESQLLQAKYTYVFRMKILDFYQGKAITLN